MLVLRFQAVSSTERVERDRDNWRVGQMNSEGVKMAGGLGPQQGGWNLHLHDAACIMELKRGGGAISFLTNSTGASHVARGTRKKNRNRLRQGHSLHVRLFWTARLGNLQRFDAIYRARYRAIPPRCVQRVLPSFVQRRGIKMVCPRRTSLPLFSVFVSSIPRRFVNMYKTVKLCNSVSFLVEFRRWCSSKCN